MKYEIKTLVGRLDKTSAYLNIGLVPKNEPLSACFAQVREKTTLSLLKE